MKPRAKPEDGGGRKPPAAAVGPEPGYDEWLAAEIEAGCAELDAGRGVPAEKVWKKLGLE